MNTQDPLKQQIEEFNQRLATMIHHQRQAFDLLVADRLRRDRAVGDESLAGGNTLVARARRWLGRHVVTRLRPYKAAPVTSPAAVDEVIDGEYRVIDTVACDNDSSH